MPMIHIEYDDAKVADKDIEGLSNAVKNIVSTITGIADVFVYANSSRIKVNVAPIEIFVRMTAQLVKDKEVFLKECKEKLVEWKKENNFAYPINLTIIPMDWKFEVSI